MKTGKTEKTEKMDIDIFEEEQKIYDEAAAVIEAVRGGADFDFEEYVNITKEYGRMLRQLRRSTRIADRTTIDLYESNLDLEDKAQIDMLTGIYNRRYMEENLKRVVRSLARTGGFLSILMIDVDFFKKYNDTYGHAEGDVCLKAVAQALAGSLARPNDFAARYGGEEFSVILPDTDESGARLIAGKILENIRALGIPHEKNDAADCVTVSVGGAAGIVLQGDSGAEYVKRADEALYRSKQTGRNRYTFI